MYKQATVDAVELLASATRKLLSAVAFVGSDINGKIRLSGYKAPEEQISLADLVFESKYSYDIGYHLAERLIASKGNGGAL